MDKNLKRWTTSNILGLSLQRMAAQQKRLSLASAMTKLDTIWKSNTISLPVKIRLYKSLVISILLCSCEGWTLNADTERRMQSFEHKCYTKPLRIHYSKHKANKYVRQRTDNLADKQEPLLTIVKESQACMVWPCESP